MFMHFKGGNWSHFFKRSLASSDAQSPNKVDTKWITSTLSFHLYPIGCCNWIIASQIKTKMHIGTAAYYSSWLSLFLVKNPYGCFDNVCQMVGSLQPLHTTLQVQALRHKKKRASSYLQPFQIFYPGLNFTKKLRYQKILVQVNQVVYA